MKTKDWIARYFISMAFIFIISPVHAGIPTWTFAPDPNYPATVTIGAAGNGVVKFLVTNASSKSHQLMIKPIDGIKQTEPCILLPKGTCTLVLAVNGRHLAATGVTGGPIVCEIDTNGTPNPYQCYQPNQEDSLNITTNNTPAIDATPETLTLTFGGETKQITIQNMSKTSIIENVTAAITPNQSNLNGITIDCNNTTCPSSCSSTISNSLLPLQSCILSIQPIAVAEEPNTNTSAIIEVSGINATATDTVKINVLLNPTHLSVTAPGIAIIPYNINNGSANLIIKNDGAFPAYNVQAVIPIADWPNVSQDFSDCAKILPGQSCTLIFKSTKPYIASKTIEVRGDNIENTPTATLAFAYHIADNDYLVFEVNSSNSTVTVIDNVDSATGVTFTAAYGPSFGTENGICSHQTKDGLIWTVPYICQMGPNNNPDDGTGDTNCNPNIANIANNLFLLGLLNSDIANINKLSGSYWSNTPASSSGGIFTARYENYTLSSSPPIHQSFTPITDTMKLRCISGNIGY